VTIKETKVFNFRIFREVIAKINVIETWCYEIHWSTWHCDLLEKKNLVKILEKFYQIMNGEMAFSVVLIETDSVESTYTM